MERKMRATAGNFKNLGPMWNGKVKDCRRTNEQKHSDAWET